MQTKFLRDEPHDYIINCTRLLKASKEPREIHQALRHCARANEDRWPATPCRGRRAPLSPARRPVNLTGAFAGTGLTRSTSPRWERLPSPSNAPRASPRSSCGGIFSVPSPSSRTYLSTYRVFHLLRFHWSRLFFIFVSRSFLIWYAHHLSPLLFQLMSLEREL